MWRVVWAFRAIIMIFESGFGDLLESFNWTMCFSVKRNDVKVAWLHILQFSPSCYIIYSPHDLFPICSYPLFVPLVLHILFPYPLIILNYSLFQKIQSIPYSYLCLNSLYLKPKSLLTLGLNSPTKTSLYMMIETHPNTPYIHLVIILQNPITPPKSKYDCFSGGVIIKKLV